MKTAISLPDPLFEAAEKLARGLGMSRSELYSRALESFIRSYSGAQVTEKLNEIYKDQRSELDPVVAAIQSASLPLDEW
jgi:metal-responsive CopG/Arc/MetJ family transcriptional regulator